MMLTRQQQVIPADENISEASWVSLADIDNGVKGSHALKRRYGALGTGAIYQCVRNNDVEHLADMLLDEAALRRVNDLNEEGLSALHLAARNCHLQIVQLLIDHGKADPNMRDEDGATPLHYCARKRQDGKSESDQVETIRLLISLVNVNARDNYNATPLHYAAVRGNVVAARELLKHRETLANVKDKRGCTPLHDAATYGHAEVAALLLRSGARLLNRDKSRYTALHAAAYEGHHAIVKLLIEACEEKKRDQLINMRDEDDAQALHYAVEAKCVEAVRILLENGADKDEPCRLMHTGRTPMHLAAIEDVPEIVTLLQQHGASLAPRDKNLDTPLHLAAQYECLKMVRHLLKQVSTPLDRPNKDQMTPLLCAAAMPCRQVVRALVEEEADLQAVDKLEQNVLHLAASRGHEKVLKYLLVQITKCNCFYLLNALDRFGNSPLHRAVKTGSLDIVRLLLDRGANIFIKNENEETPTIIAAKLGLKDIVEEFLRRDEKVLNDQDEDSNTALHVAAERGHLEVTRLLCQRGADVLDRNVAFRVPMDLAALHGHEDIVKLFLDEGMAAEPAEKEKETPLQLACMNGHERTVATLVAAGADINKQNECCKSCLTLAIDRGHRAVVTEILKSSQWREALCTETNPDNKARSTPLRHLIRKMPEAATEALNRCVTCGPEGVAETDPDYYIDFNLELLDDTYVTYGPKCSIFDEEVREDELIPPASVKAYTPDLNWIKTNHPLSIIVRKKHRRILLDHPVVLALINQKWSTGSFFYFLFCLFYALFLVAVTTFMVASTPPYMVEAGMLANNSDLCDVDSETLVDVSQICVFVFAAFGMIIEVFQLVSTGWLYVQEPVNLIDWFCYVSAVVIVIDIGGCNLREEWQWKLGAFTVLGVWINFLLFFRRFPALGIYVVMVTEICKTFAKICIIFFLFIIAFGLSFHMLLQNQAPFAEPFDAIMKTLVQMTGEQEFTDIFFNDADPASYRGVTYAIYVIFLALVAIILSNLLVGLAVDDVNQLRIEANRVKLSMQVNLALDVEMALPSPLRRYFKCNKRRVRLYPNRKYSWMQKLVKMVTAWLEGPLLMEKTIVEGVKALDEAQTPTLHSVHETLSRRIQDNQTRITAVQDQLDRMEAMLLHLCGGKPGKKAAKKLRKHHTLTQLLNLKTTGADDSDSTVA